MWRIFARASSLWTWVALLGLTSWGLYERQRDLVQMFDTVFGDEANTMACAMHNLPECSHIELSQFWKHVTSTAWGGVPALYFFILAALFKLFGTNIYTARILQVTLGSLCIPVVYGLCRQLDMRRQAALLAAALFAASRWHLIASRIGWPNPMAAFTVALTILLAMIATRRRQPIWWVLGGLSLTLCMNTYIAAHIALFIAALWLMLLLVLHAALPALVGLLVERGKQVQVTTYADRTGKGDAELDAVSVGATKPGLAPVRNLAWLLHAGAWRPWAASVLAVTAIVVALQVRWGPYSFVLWAIVIWAMALVLGWRWIQQLLLVPSEPAARAAINPNSRSWRFSAAVVAGILIAIVTFVITWSPWLHFLHANVAGNDPSQDSILRELQRYELRAGTVFILSDFQRKHHWPSQHPDVPNDTFSILKWQTVAVLQMFNIRGDTNALQNIPGYPMLDTLSGCLFVLGMLIMSWHWRRPFALLMLIWFWLALVTSTILTENAPNANRAVVVLPVLYVFIGAAINLTLALADALGKRLRERGTTWVKPAVVLDVGVFVALCTTTIITMRVNLRDFFTVYASNRGAYGGYNPRDTLWSYLASDLDAKAVVVYGSFAHEQHLALAPAANVIDATPRVAGNVTAACTAPQTPSHPDLIIVLNQEPKCYSESFARDPADPLSRPTPQYYINEWERRFPGSKFQEAYNRYHDLMFYWMAPR